MMGNSVGKISIERTSNGAFGKGNKAWALRKRHGAKQKFPNAEALSVAVQGYFDWVDLNPLYKEKVFNEGGKFVLIAIPRLRAMTLAGLCLHIGISHRQWNAWKMKGGKYYRSDLQLVIESAEQLIWVQKFEGAAAGLFNPKIVAHELRLKR